MFQTVNETNRTIMPCAYALFVGLTAQKLSETRTHSWIRIVYASSCTGNLSGLIVVVVVVDEKLIENKSTQKYLINVITIVEKINWMLQSKKPTTIRIYWLRCYFRPYCLMQYGRRSHPKLFERSFFPLSLSLKYSAIYGTGYRVRSAFSFRHSSNKQNQKYEIKYNIL